MSENPIAALFTGIGVLSLCTLCALGPAAFGSAVVWAFGWIGGFNLAATLGIAIFLSLLAHGLFWRWSTLDSRQDSDSVFLVGPTNEEKR